LKNGLGHYLEYVKSIIDPIATNGRTALVLVNQEADTEVMNSVPAQKVFRHEIWNILPRIHRIPRVGRWLNTVVENVRFFLRIRWVLNERRIDSEWLIFCDMVCHNQILAWSWWHRSLPRRKRPLLVLLFRYSTDWFYYWYGESSSQRAFKGYEALSTQGLVHFASDSARLALEYARLTNLPIEVLPIPHTTHSFHGGKSKPAAKPEGCLRMVSIGGARDEKGIMEILQAIEKLSESGEIEKFEFAIQTTGATECTQALVKHLQGKKLTRVRFIAKRLSTEEYYRLLSAADVVLLPYWREIYVSRTSGIFAEAVAAGKPVIVTEDTWMSDQLENYGGGVFVRNRDVDDLVRAIAEMRDRYGELRKAALMTRTAWRNKHSPEALLAAVMEMIDGG